MNRIAVILFNLGGPDNPQAVKPFLANLFHDPAIIRFPWPLRHFIAWLIVKKRRKAAEEIYGQIGGRSPILENTKMQARELEKALSHLGDVKCFIAMRYWYPLADQTVREVKNFAPDTIILLPLYPQFSSTTTASSLKSWHQAARAAGLTALTKTICCYPEDGGFIRALAAAARAAYDKAEAFSQPRILFSAHGLPEKIIQAGDPYQWQCERTAAALVREIKKPGLDWVVCYQSRVGPLKWIGPSTEEEIARAGREGKSLVVVPIAFVSEHAETLVEIDILYRKLAASAGVPGFVYVPAVGTAPDFIEGLAGMVRRSLQNPEICLSGRGGRICPGQFEDCGYYAL